MPTPLMGDPPRLDPSRCPLKWEYKTVKLRATGLLGGKFDDAQLERAMNELGQQGWELTTAFDTNEAYGSTRDIVVLFKRSAP